MGENQRLILEQGLFEVNFLLDGHACGSEVLLIFVDNFADRFPVFPVPIVGVHCGRSLLRSRSTLQLECAVV